MAEKAAAHPSRSWRFVAASLVLLLYALPFSEKFCSGSRNSWSDLKISYQAPVAPAAGEPPYFAEDFVNQARPGVICHVSGIVEAGGDRLICTWYAGSREAAPDVAIYAAFFRESTRTWTEPEVLLDRRRSSAELKRWVRKLGNAVVMNDQRGGLWLFYATMLGGWSTATLNYKVSRNEGRSWSASRPLILSPFFNLTTNVKNKGVGLSRGAFLLPAYHELLHKFSQILLVRPAGADPWFEMRRMTSVGKAIQPAIIPAGKESLISFFRNAAGGGKSHILRAESRDVGQDWSGLSAIPLPNPDAGFDMIRLADGAILAAINNSFQDRDNLTLVISRDEGKTWQTLRVLENTPGKSYAYPSLARAGKYYHLTYSYEKNRIKHVMFNQAWLQQQRSHDH
jgi:predicted neuraminidase|uniref:Sialidase domain-containing protein n=1 Tax=Desulfobacca acetoxidans TaxID=60893 RepID=A0A7V6A4N8_9BACT